MVCKAVLDIYKPLQKAISAKICLHIELNNFFRFFCTGYGLVYFFPPLQALGINSKCSFYNKLG